MSETVNVFVHTLRYEAQDVISVELRPMPGAALAPFEAGSHIDLHLPNGLVRSYSLCNPCSEQHRYVIGVLRDRSSRGGSRCVHEQLRVGMQLAISPPRNNFPLQEAAAHTVLIAGGIGVTPILCMARRLKLLSKSFEVMYFARSRAGAAFVDDLQALGVPLHLHFDDEQGGPPDLAQRLGRRAPSSQDHYYACGPGVMLESFLQVCAQLGHQQAHIERFTAVDVAAAADARASYTVSLKRSGRTLTVSPDQSLLDTLLAAGLSVDHSCCEGVCGSCETQVLEGLVDHRDSVLSANERASNKVMMVCVSGCKSDTLVLDL